MKGLVAFFCIGLLAITLVFYFNEPFETVQLCPVLDGSPPLRIGVIPYLPTDEMTVEFAPITEYLQKKLGRKIYLTVAADYKSLAKLLDHAKIHLAVFSHGSYELLGKDKDWEVICRPMQRGQVYSRGSIVVKSDSGISSIDGLKGKGFAYVDRYSGTGFVFANKIFEEAGLSPLDDFSGVSFTLSHEASIRGLLEGKYEGTAVYDGAPLFLSELEAGVLRVLAKTDPIPTDPIVVKATLDADLKEQIRVAMLEMHKDEDGIEHMKTLHKRRGTERFINERELSEILAAENDE